LERRTSNSALFLTKTWIQSNWPSICSESSTPSVLAGRIPDNPPEG
jgi:hypothetical protein